ncbi:MAG: hypothetical protein PF495_06215 [Spirochaetales bacterium]|jgi:hypothetical protein|nr:hypothetical protein [Spirochaetales bacterium]
MIKILTLATILSVVGCQTAKINVNDNIESKPKTITLTVSQDGKGYDMQLSVNTVDDKMYCPSISVMENEWGFSGSSVDIKGFNYVTQALIGDETVEINCEPGMRAAMKVIPLETGKVQVKGMYVYNRLLDEKLTRPTTVIPFNVIVKIGEPTVIYEMKMEFESGF